MVLSAVNKKHFVKVGNIDSAYCLRFGICPVSIACTRINTAAEADTRAPSSGQYALWPPLSNVFVYIVDKYIVSDHYHNNNVQHVVFFA